MQGFIHSDGCRIANRIVKRDKVYVCPRYLFTNESRDIMGLCQYAAVAALDRHVGAKP
ncbi:hypothetical protein [Micromonospora sp. NPDC049679]|uniref:hypothetical protein n=1 Tax=Micromonospora sp. NPDC049679 TaxID=3155920 RepID=UPI0033C99C29